MMAAHTARAATRQRQRGAALLLAMVILTLVATLAAGMVWQQSRSVQVEAAQRARSQAEWILNAGLDFSRLILREDGRANNIDHLGEPWAQQLGEARLSSLLAADKENNADGGLEAFLSGRIVDAQSRYNLLNLMDAENKVAPAELKALERLCDAVGVPSDTASRLSEGLRLARGGAGATAAAGGDDGAGGPPLVPTRVEQLAWLGLDAATLQKLTPYVTLLPERTPVNANTAPREVLLAAIDGLDLATAERLVQVRQRNPFENLAAIEKELPQGTKKPEETRINWRSSYFEVFGLLRLEDRALQEHTLVVRRGADRGLDVVALQRERNSVQGSASAAP